MSNEKLHKGLKELLTSALIATGGAQPKSQFNAQGLHPDLLPIAYLESSMGQNVNHKQHSKGEFHTATGSLGLKPITAHEEYLKSGHLKKLYPNLDDIKNFNESLKTNPNLYNHIASAHWNRLKNSFGDKKRAAFAWRYGANAATKVTPEVIDNDKYIKGYNLVSKKLGLDKSDDLNKAIADIKPGKLKQKELGGKLKTYNYDHLLSPDHIKEGYSLAVIQSGDHKAQAKVSHGGKYGGELIAEKLPSPILAHKMKVQDALLRPEHVGKGLGSSMYEALFAHAKHKMGVRDIQGGVHSSMARRVHEKLSEKHGLNYSSVPNYGPGADFDTQKDWSAVKPGAFDAKYRNYEYELKSEEEMNKSISSIHPGKEVVDEAGDKSFDYSHVLPDAYKNKGYKLAVHDMGDSLDAYVSHPDNHMPVGNATFSYDKHSITPEVSGVHHEHRQKGLGQALYEAAFAHGMHHKGIKQVAGDIHSTSASKMHQKLSQVHGMEYSSLPNLNSNRTPGSDYDQAYGPYRYVLKSELSKSLNEWFSMSKKLSFEHFSYLPNLKELDPKFQGSGVTRGLEKVRPNRIPRVYVYESGSEVESVVNTLSLNKYIGELEDPKLYDFGKDSLELLSPKITKSENGVFFNAPDLDKVERFLLDNGFDGYKNYNRSYPKAIALFVKVPVKRA